MASIDELAVNVKDLADLQISLAQKLNAIESRLAGLESRAPQPAQPGDVEGVRAQLDALRSDADSMRQALSTVATLESRLRALESAPRDSGDVTGIINLVNRLQADVTEMRSKISGGSSSVDVLQSTLNKHQAEIDELSTTAQNMRQQMKSPDEMSSGIVRKMVDRHMDELESEIGKRTDQAVSEHVKKFREMYADMNNRLATLLGDSRRKTEGAVEEFRHESAAALTTADQHMRNVQQESALAIRRYQELYAETERKNRESTMRTNEMMLAELKKEAERLRTSTLESLIDVRDRLKHVEVIEQNLEGKLDSKLNEVSKTFADLFEHTSKTLKEEIYGEFTNELAEIKADVEKTKVQSTDNRSDVDALTEQLDTVTVALEDLLRKKEGDESGLMKDLEALEKRLKA